MKKHHTNEPGAARVPDFLVRRAYEKAQTLRDFAQAAEGVLLPNPPPLDLILRLDIELANYAVLLPLQGSFAPRLAEALYEIVIFPALLGTMQSVEATAAVFECQVSQHRRPSVLLQGDKFATAPDRAFRRATREAIGEFFVRDVRAAVEGMSDESLLRTLNAIGRTLVATKQIPALIVNPEVMTFAREVLEFLVNDTKEQVTAWTMCGNAELCVAHRTAWSDLTRRKAETSAALLNPYEAARKYPRLRPASPAAQAAVPRG